MYHNRNNTETKALQKPINTHSTITLTLIASEMAYTVSDGALNSTQSNLTLPVITFQSCNKTKMNTQDECSAAVKRQLSPISVQQSRINTAGKQFKSD